MLSRIACDMLRLLCDHSVYLLDNHPDIPRKIIEGLTSSLMAHVNSAKREGVVKEYKDLILTIILCLGEWCMNVPQDFLKSSQPLGGSSASLLATILRAFNSIVYDKENSTPVSSPVSPMSPTDTLDMDFTVYADGSDFSAASSPPTKVANTVIRHPEETGGENNVIKVAARMFMGYLFNYVGHFPRPYLGAARLNSYLNENDDNDHVTVRSDDCEEISADVFSAPNVLFFVVNNSSIISFTEVSTEDGTKSKVRVLIRDLIGKFAWDCKQIAASKLDTDLAASRLSSNARKEQRNLKPIVCEDEFEDQPTVLKDDMLDSLLQYVGQTSPECFSNSSKSKRPPLAPATEENMMALLLNQHYQEMNFMEQASDEKVILRNGSVPDFRGAARALNGRHEQYTAHFTNCRQLVDQLGFLFWEKRTKVELLAKNDKVLRELRNLDKQKCRETHKIAVIYVAEGQEDKNSILLNRAGSRAFETFVAGLGWEVDLEKHLGFRGGLQKNKSTGSTAPYYATPFMEVMFHVSTRIPASLEESDSLTRKLRHLGNDEIHIIWSEHWRDYRRDIIPTEFGDVLIIIYPIPSLLDYYRVQIIRKPEVPFFGPLFSGSVVHQTVLAGLVRATAVNASRAQRLNVAYYQNFFEERARCLDLIVNNQDPKCFEDFAATVYSPSQLGVLASRPVSSLSNTLTGSGGDTYSMSSMHSNSHLNPGGEPSPNPRTRNRPVSHGPLQPPTIDHRSPRGQQRPVSSASSGHQ